MKILVSADLLILETLQKPARWDHPAAPSNAGASSTAPFAGIWSLSQKFGEPKGANPSNPIRDFGVIIRRSWFFRVTAAVREQTNCNK